MVVWGCVIACYMCNHVCTQKEKLSMLGCWMCDWNLVNLVLTHSGSSVFKFFILNYIKHVWNGNNLMMCLLFSHSRFPPQHTPSYNTLSLTSYSTSPLSQQEELSVTKHTVLPPLSAWHSSNTHAHRFTTPTTNTQTGTPHTHSCILPHQHRHAEPGFLSEVEVARSGGC